MSDSGGAPEPADGRRGPRRLVAIVSGVVVFVAALVAIPDDVRNLLPKGPEPCAREGAALSNITVEERVPFREYLERTNASTEGYSGRQLLMRVNLISYDLRIDGFKNKHLTSRWSVYDARTKTAVADEQLRNRIALDVEPTACATTLHPAIWAPVVARKGRFYYTLFVYDDNGNLLAERRSEPFSARA